MIGWFLFAFGLLVAVPAGGFAMRSTLKGEGEDDDAGD